MAPINRVRPAEEDVEVLESASSNFRRTSNQKRQRLERRQDSDESDSDTGHGHNGDGGFTATQIARRGGNREEYERSRDNLSEDGDEEDALERATQDIRAQKSRGRGMADTAADCGVIETITCINFMCHTRLEIKLGPQINFIIGHNGSGKSAVLTALTLCLGGKATSTNRGQSLKSFIKEGQDSATLVVKIKNRGDAAYRQDVYGESIIVERHFTLQGSSGFKIRSVNGKVVSTKRAELDEIIDFYTFQLDNPVNVLTQDMARQFLNTSSELEKYKFFIRGVQLEQLDNDYILLTDSLDAVDGRLDTIEDDCKILHDDFKRAEAKFNISQQQDGLRGRFEAMSRQMAWAQVEEQERTLVERQNQVRQADEKVVQLREDVKQYENTYEDTCKLLEKAKADHGNLEKELEPLAATQEAAKDDFTANGEELREVMQAQRTLEGQIKSHIAEIKAKKAEAEAERRRLEAVDGGSTALKLGEIDAAEQELSDIKRRKAEHPEALPALENAKRSAELRQGDAKSALKAKQEDLTRANSSLMQLRDSRPRPYAGYGNVPVENIVRAINQETRWRQKPVGPAGEHVKLLKPEWSNILESWFGAGLNGFVVTCKEDEGLLSAIIDRNRARGKFPVFISKPGTLVTTPHEPDQRLDTVLRVLEIDNELIRNHFIINQAIEQVVLVQDREEAYETMYGSTTSTRNIKQCITIHPHNRQNGIVYMPGVNGGQKSNPIKGGRGGVPRMQSDIQAQIRLQSDVASSIKSEILPLEEATRNCQNEVLKCNQAIGAHTKETKAITVAEQRARFRITELKDELEEMRPGEGTLDSIKQMLAEKEVEHETDTNQFNESVTVRKELNDKATVLKRALDSADRTVEVMNHQIEQAAANVHDSEETRKEALKEKNAAINRITTAQREREEREEARLVQQTQVEDFTGQASLICARVPVDRGATAASLDKKLKAMHDELQKFERQVGGTREQISRDMTKKKDAFQAKERQKDDIQKLADTLRSSVRDRHQRWKHFLKHISIRAKAGFAHLLKERDFEGKLILNHKDRKLQLRIQPDRTARGADGRKTQTLSGGEKSFSTICLLLALWDAMGSPIRCLDEFDVFMDSVNRDQSMKIMLHAARGSVGRQFIFITPQAMGNVQAADDIRINKLLDPERGQTTLLFGQ